MAPAASPAIANPCCNRREFSPPLDAAPEIVNTSRQRRLAVVAMSRNSATVLSLGDYRARQRTVYFTRSELNQLLGLYSRQVIRGEWRDYAIDHRDGMALFSVFRHTQEGPLFSIVKTLGSMDRPAEFAVRRGRERLRSARSLADALEFFRSRLSLVAAAPG
jgi:hypothetical protein